MGNDAPKMLGMKWFKFFTKIRSWIGVVLGALFALSTIVQLADYFEYGSFNSLVVITIIQIICYAVSAVMSLFLALKTDDYEKSVISSEALFKYIKALLIFEVLYMEFSWVISKYYEGAEISLIVITSIMCFLMEYFIWYRPNIKYFKRRLITTKMITNETEPSYRIADDDLYKSKEYGNHIYAKDIMLQTDGDNTSHIPIQPEKPVETQYQTTTEQPTAGKVKFCSRCGGKIDNKTKKCTGCGKQYFKGFKAKNVLSLVLILLLILSALFNVYLYTRMLELDNSDEVAKLQSEVTSLESKNSTLKTENSKLKNKVSNLEGELDVCYQEINFIDEFVVFIEDDGTNLYHKYQCHKFVGNGFWAFNVEAATGEGYSPCPLCCD